MQELIDGFLNRYSEVEEYLEFLVLIEDPGTSVCSGTLPQIPIRSCWVNTARATGYLVIYNCIEATVRTAFDFLYSEVKRSTTDYLDFSTEFRKLWVDQYHKSINLYSSSPKIFAEKAMAMLDHAIEKSTIELHSNRLPVSGNLDADKIREIMRRHGIEFSPNRNASGGSWLGSVRQRRNSLSHGNLSFVECGRDVTGSELAQIARQTKYFLIAFLKGIREFASRRGYRV